jgi:DNA-binding transcriptional regulator WhiA
MGKTGQKPKGRVKIKWSANFAYAVGLLVSDGCLYNDGRHLSFVSKDEEQIKNFVRCLGIKVKIGSTTSGYKNKKALRVQFGDVLFFAFLQGIGIHPRKSKTISEVTIPQNYFFDFLRGSFDGDGTFYSYWDKRWRSSYMYYLEFISASQKHIEWLRNTLNDELGVKGHVTTSARSSAYQLKYAKKEALAIIKKMYYNRRVVCLSRKREKIEKAVKVEIMQQKHYS